MTCAAAPDTGRAGADCAPDPITVLTDSAEQTAALAGALAPLFRAGDVLLLAGDLGAGKTTFTKGLARALGVTEPVTSPTFTLVRSYRTTPSPGTSTDACSVRSLVHADIFRLDHLREIVDLAIGEMLEEGALAVVEWGDLAIPVLGRDALVMSLLHGSGTDERSATFRLTGYWESRRDDLRARLRSWRSARRE